jgi:type I restriction enzyme S subunit
MKYLALDSLIEKPISGEWGTGDGDINVIRSANFTNHGRINFDKIVARNIPDDKVRTKKLQEEDIIIEKSGGSPTQPVGRVVFFDKKGTYLCSNFTSILRPLKQYVAPKYLHYILFCNHKFGFVEKYQNKTTGIINLQLPKYLKNTKIPLPPLAEQQKIASILDAADSLRQKDQQLIEKYTALSQSLFLEMFGDPVSNPKKWAIKAFGNSLIDIVGGKSVGGEQRQIKDNEKAVLKISAVTTGIFNSLEYKVVEDFEVPDILVHPLKGDLLFSRANTRELVGATCIVDEDYEYLFLPDKLWRLDLKLEMVCNWYLRFLLTHDGFRENLRKVATGTSGSMLNISKAKLKQLKILLPPIELQNQFAERIQLIEAQKKQAQASLEKSAALFNSLLQRAFKGELTA